MTRCQRRKTVFENLVLDALVQFQLLGAAVVVVVVRVVALADVARLGLVRFVAQSWVDHVGGVASNIGPGFVVVIVVKSRKAFAVDDLFDGALRR